jgi:type II secretory ATPase GspE/PulE/Tfp pilus assembly ATPase PilB-like protein
MLASSLFAVVAQRLVRKICPYCKEAYNMTEQERLSLEFSGIMEWPEEVHRGKGCNTCKGSGYMGRTVIGEILIIDDDIKGLINEGASTQTIKEKALEKGMKTLLMDGIRKVKLGITTIEEVLRVAG